MFKHMLLLVLFGLVYSAPAPDAKPEPAPKTPASTEKLTPVIAPLPSLAAVPQIALPLTAVPLSPIAYTYVAPLKIAAVPSTYTVEQHGYSITY